MGSRVTGMQMAELLPCPFCGSEKIKIEESQYRAVGAKSFKSSFRIRCGNTYGCLVKPSLKMTKHEDAVKIWNTRGEEIIDPETGEIPKALEENEEEEECPPVTQA